MNMRTSGFKWFCCVTVIGLIGGCASEGHTSFFANPDPALRKSAVEFAVDGAKRSYESTARKAGQAQARATFDQQAHRIDIVNLSETDWHDVEVWINQTYVVLVPTMPKGEDNDKKLDFEMFYDQGAHHFDTDGGKNPIKTIEIFRDGAMYTVPATQE